MIRCTRHYAVPQAPVWSYNELAGNGVKSRAPAGCSWSPVPFQLFLVYLAAKLAQFSSLSKCIIRGSFKALWQGTTSNLITSAASEYARLTIFRVPSPQKMQGSPGVTPIPTPYSSPPNCCLWHYLCMSLLHSYLWVIKPAWVPNLISSHWWGRYIWIPAIPNSL